MHTCIHVILCGGVQLTNQIVALIRAAGLLASLTSLVPRRPRGGRARGRLGTRLLSYGTGRNSERNCNQLTGSAGSVMS